VKLRQFGSLVVIVILCLSAGVAVAADPKHASIEGSYKLVSRTQIDSTVNTAPEVIGLQTFTKTYRNFNVAWKNADGKTFSYSVISKYTLTDSSYTETRLYSIMNDEIGGTGLKYEFVNSTLNSPVTFENGKVSFKMPFDPVSVVVEGDKMTATGEAGFIDAWFKIR
jgi:hypothetical protein